jgi:hypothetical protein
LGLALFRRAGIRWFDAYPAARDAALSVLPRAEEVDKRLQPWRIAKCAPSERERRERRRDAIEGERDELAATLAYLYQLERADEHRRAVTRQDFRVSNN